MASAMLVEEGNVTGEEANAAMVGLITIFLEVSATCTELANTNESAGLDSMSFLFAPGALVVESLVGPIPWTVYSLLDAIDVTRVERGGGWREGVGDVPSEASICVGFGETTGCLSKGESIICQLFSQISKLTSSPDNLSFSCTMTHNLCTKGVVILLVHSPVNSFSVDLSFREEELLSKIEGRAWKLVGSSMEGACVDRACAS
jgi:hypothetical protein